MDIEIDYIINELEEVIKNGYLEASISPEDKKTVRLYVTNKIEFRESTTGFANRVQGKLLYVIEKLKELKDKNHTSLQGSSQ